MRPSFASLVASCCTLSLLCVGVHAQNPIASALQSTAARAARNLVESAEEMPADKYGYKPTPAQMSFGQVVLHLAGGNDMMCGWIAGTPARFMPSTVSQVTCRISPCVTSNSNVLGQGTDTSIKKIGNHKWLSHDLPPL